jgi:predicted MFS family arabinose efflux permease
MGRRHGGERAATYREVLASREFRWLVAGQTLSLIGDQALRVALSVLVFQDTASAWLTGLAYALTYVPWVVGGPLLASLADRMSRRQLMIMCDLGRALLVGLVALPGQPLGLLYLWVLLASLLTPPFESARSALLPDMLTGDRYVVGVSLWTAINQVTQVVGFGGGGLAVAKLGAPTVLSLDAATFLVSAATITFGLRSPYRPVDPAAPVRLAAATRTLSTLTRESVAGIRAVLGERTLRALLLIAWWAPAIALVPEAIAAPYALDGHGGTGMTGWYMAAIPAGVVVGTLVLGRLVRPADRTAYIFPLAVLATAPLVVFLADPPRVPALMLLFAAGAALSYQLPLQASFVLAVPPHLRGRAFAVAASGLEVGQGVGALLGGGLTDAFGPASAIGWSGMLGVAVMVPLAVSGARAVFGSGLSAASFDALAAEPVPVADVEA